MRTNLPVTAAETALAPADYLISRTDQKGRIVFANPAFVRISGYTHEELVGAPHNLVRHPDMPEAAFADLWASFDLALGAVAAPTEKTRRARACKELREGHYSAADLLVAAETWPNVMGDATMTELGLAANMGKLLRGPQRNGRHNGTVTAHRQSVTEYAAVNRGQKRGSAALDDDFTLSGHLNAS